MGVVPSFVPPAGTTGYLSQTVIDQLGAGMASIFTDVVSVITMVLPAGLAITGVILAVRMMIRMFRMFGRS